MNNKATKKDHAAVMAEAHLQGLAGEFLDLWQANLMAWASDPESALRLQQACRPASSTARSDTQNE